MKENNNHSRQQKAYILLEDDYYTAVDIKQKMAMLRPNYVLIGESDSVTHATELLQDCKADLIISDVMLADGDCQMAFRSTHCTTPVIFFTCHEGLRKQLQEFNPITVVFKPISLNDVETAINTFEQTI